MKYILKNIAKHNLYRNKVKLKNKQILVYSVTSRFGKTIYRNKLSRLYTTKNSNRFFTKKRRLKHLLLNIKQVDFSTKNGFFVELLLVGLGFKVIRIKALSLLFFELHFSHKLYYALPINVSVRCIKKKIVLFGIQKSQLINIAEQIKALRYPNTYKGKGIKYFDEIIKVKPGKQR